MKFSRFSDHPPIPGNRRFAGSPVLDTSRAIRKKLLTVLSEPDPEKSLAGVRAFSAKQVIGPLFAHFFHGDPLIRWRAISGMGAVVSGLAETGRMEDARVVMRRLMWSLNDESGGIGWGSPEAMGDILARSEVLAREFHRILVSYVMPEGNFLEHEILQRGLLWGIGRLSHARPPLIAPAARHLIPFLESDDPFHRGLAVWALGPVADDSIKDLIKKSGDDSRELPLYLNGHLTTKTVSDLVMEALNRLS